MTAIQQFCETATGCRGAGDYHVWAEQQGYSYCEVLDWTSSAGDWTFIVSRDGETWYIMEQLNAYPDPGFRRSIDTEWPLSGTAEEIIEFLTEALDFP